MKKLQTKYRTKDTILGTYENKSDKASKRDIIDRTGYIPLELQLQRMKVSGQSLIEGIDRQFGYEFKDIQDVWNGTKSIDEITKDETLTRRFLDKTEVEELYRRKIEKYGNVINEREAVARLKAEYEKNEELAKIKREAINDYIAQQKELNKNV